LAWLAELLYAIAVAHIRTGCTGEALDLLQEAVDAGWRDANWLEHDPEMEPLYRDPRFLGLVKQVRSFPQLQLHDIPG
jgi:hypothetical protein